MQIHLISCQKMTKNKAKKILIPLPSYGFDPSEVAIPWKILNAKGFEITFATPQGKAATADRIMLNGKGLGLFQLVLKARQDAVEAYSEMILCKAFLQPMAYTDLIESDFDGLLLPGGHDKGVKEYLESESLQKLSVDFFNQKKAVGAICHGVIVLARSIDPKTKQSVLYNYKTTALLASQEILAFQLSRLWLKDYYLTYPGKTVEAEVSAALKEKSNFRKGNLGISRDSEKHLNKGFCVLDQNYLSARWPGDVYNFALAYAKLLKP